MKRIVSLMIVLALVLAMALSVASAEEKKSIAFLPPAMISPYYATCIAGAEPVAEELGFRKRRCIAYGLLPRRTGRYGCGRCA